jgi:hypothetical protein
MEISKTEEPTKSDNQQSNTPNGFGQGVNNYLNHYITVADAKAVAILTGAFAILAATIEFNSDCCLLKIGIILTFILNILTIFFCLWILYPRLGSSGKGLIFWESIRANLTPEEYSNKVNKLNTKTVEEEYAHQNWYVSLILKQKNGKIRTALWFFGMSILSIAVLYLLKNIL